MDSIYFGKRHADVRKSPFGIFVNQVGYYPDSVKKAVMSFPCESFCVQDKDGVTCFEGKAEHWGYDENSGDDVYIADFSDFRTNGVYRIASGRQRSALFSVSSDPYQKVFDDVTKAFYYLRCGCGLDERFAGMFRHGKCHTGLARLWEDGNTVLDVSGGWHDAGDYGRYVTAGACALAHLLYAYKLFPSPFDKQRLNIPESGESSVPDILSECRYELEWLMKMQRGDGGVYHKATTAMHAPFVMPEDDTAQMYVFPVSSMAAADLAAVCALASGVYERYDKTFSEKLRGAAELSCKWLDANGFVGFQNPAGCNTGSYGERDDNSNRFWAYSEMYALTGDNAYMKKMINSLNEDFPLAALGYVEVGGFGALAYLLSGREKDGLLTEKFTNAFQSEAERLKNIADKCGYGCAMEDKSYHWGSNMTLMKHGMIFAINDRLFGNNKYKDYAAAQLDYLLGVNALGYSYVTGNGEFCCNYPHLRPAHADGIDECIPGMVSGGPNRFPADADAKVLIPDGTPPMKCYADDVGCYSLNEITIYWNSPTVFVLAYLLR